MSVTVHVHNGAGPIVVHTRRQHAMGQGGFHSATLSGGRDLKLLIFEHGQAHGLGGSSLRWVYDCGSQSSTAVGDEVEAFLGGARPTLDFLFVSHLDTDHINGIPRLLRAGDGALVDTIALPYVDHVERMIVFAKAVSDAKAENGFLRSLVIDSVEALQGFGPRRIIFFRSGPDREDTEDFGIDGPRDGEGPRWKLIGPDRSRPVGHTLSGASAGVEAAVVQDTASVDVNGADLGLGWIFKPHVRKADPKLVAAFEAAAEKKLGWPAGTFRARVADKAMRATLVSNKQQASRLSAAYKATFGGKNVTTLSVYTGPRPDDPPVRAWAHWSGVAALVSHHEIGWLGTGDADLETAKWSTDYLKRYSAEIGRTWTFMLPHHGALGNFNDKLLALDPKVCVACASPANPAWNHPHPSVVKAVTDHPAHFVHVTYAAASAFDESFVVLL